MKRVCVVPFENPTTESGLETLFANDLVNELIRNTGLVLTDRHEADAILSGKIASMTMGTISQRGSHTPVERQVRIVAAVELTDPEGGVIWSARDMSFSQAYFVMPEKLLTEHHRREALSEISRRLAEHVYQQLTDN